MPSLQEQVNNLYVRVDMEMTSCLLPHMSLKAMLAKAMLAPSSLEELLRFARGNPMPFWTLNDNLIFAAIRELHAEAKPVDIITVFEFLNQRGEDVAFADLSAMVTAPLLDPLLTENLCIRPFLPSDCEKFVSAVRESVESLGRWLPWFHRDYSLIDAVKWFTLCASNQQAGTAYDLGIFSKSGTELFGGIAINHIRSVTLIGNLGYWVRTTHQRRGIALEALRRMVDFGFGELRLERLEIVTAETNHPSRALATRIGARLECIAPRRLRVNEDTHDAAIYSLVRKDPSSAG